MNTLIATWPFDTFGDRLVDKLVHCGCQVNFNPFQRRLKKEELAELLADAEIVVAGTEPYTRDVLTPARRLRLISRVGIGLDSVDLDYCPANNVRVSYTPDAPSRGVAELTIHHMLALTRRTMESHNSVVDLSWERHVGELLSEHCIGLLGFGRIGRLVAECLRPFGATVLAHDIAPDAQAARDRGVELVSCEELFRRSTILSVHIPLNPENHHFVSQARIDLMPPGALLINTARGAVVDEESLARALQARRLRGAALDVFEQEPYTGPLRQVPGVILSAHIGASARATRRQMESEAVQAVEAFTHGEAWKNYVV
jgi:D-3-phosphoglycerate dehydrogenase